MGQYEDLVEALRRQPLNSVLAAVGGLWVASQVVRLSSFCYLYFLRRSQLDRYRCADGKESWALVTGASDGIGRGFAEELCARGFNVVLHGRDESKLSGVRDELLQQWPQREIKLMMFDAMTEMENMSKLEATVEGLRDTNLKILVNNVASLGTMEIWKPLQDARGRDIASCIEPSARFPTDLTRLLIPQLIQNEPALILNIGSGASEFATPYASVYSAVKAYNLAWSRSLSAEMKLEGRDIEVLGLLIGMVATSRTKRPTTFFMPTPRRMAQSCLDVVGCGRSIVWPYWPHLLQFAPILAMPEWLLEKLLGGLMIAERDKHQAEAKKQ